MPTCHVRLTTYGRSGLEDDCMEFSTGLKLGRAKAECAIRINDRLDCVTLALGPFETPLVCLCLPSLENRDNILRYAGHPYSLCCHVDRRYRHFWQDFESTSYYVSPSSSHSVPARGSRGWASITIVYYTMGFDSIRLLRLR